MKKLLTISALSVTVAVNAQNVGIGTLAPNASAQLEVSSTNKGMLVPRMTLAQRTAISNPAQGLLVYQTDGTNGFYVNRSAIPAVPNWSAITEGINQWAPGLIANSIYNINTGNVGVGTASPLNLFTVQTSGIGISQQSPDASTQVGFFTATGAAYVQTHTNHDLLFSTNNGSAQLTLKTGGNFGVGNTNPTNKLDVTGTFRATGNAVFGGTVQIQGGSPGTGKVLTSDATGNASWQTPAVASCMQNCVRITSLTYTNFTVPAGVTKVFVEMVGSGGDGSSSGVGLVLTGGGGGGGAYASFFLTVTPGSTIQGRVKSTDGSDFYTVFKYSGDSVMCNDGDPASSGGGSPGRGGLVILGGAGFTNTLGLVTVNGEDGKANSFINYTYAGSTYTDYIGGTGGGSYKSFGQPGQITRVNNVGTETTKAELSTFKGPGAGGGAITRAGGVTTGSRTGGSGEILIYY